MEALQDAELFVTRVSEVMLLIGHSVDMAFGQQILSNAANGEIKLECFRHESPVGLKDGTEASRRCEDNGPNQACSVVPCRFTTLLRWPSVCWPRSLITLLPRFLLALCARHMSVAVLGTFAHWALSVRHCDLALSPQIVRRGLRLSERASLGPWRHVVPGLGGVPSLLSFCHNPSRFSFWC